MSGNKQQDRTRSLLAVSACALTYYIVGVFGTQDNLAVSAAFGEYWLPNALLLAALLLNSARRGLQLLVVSVAHILPLLGSKLVADEIACSLICNEGLVIGAAAVLRPLMDERARSRYWLSLNTTSVTQAISSALVLVVAAWLLVSLGDVTAISPAASALIEECFAVCTFETAVAFATVTPAIVSWSRRQSPLASQQVVEALLAISIAALVCVAACLHEGVIGTILLCLLPVVALWAGLCLGAKALTGCLLAAMLALQLLARPGEPVDQGIYLFLFATAIGSLTVLALGERHRAQLEIVSRRLVVATTRARRARARFERRNRRQKLMLQALDGAVFCWDLQRDSLWWNARATRYFGPTSRIQAGWLIWNDCIGAADTATMLQELRRLLISKETSWHREFTIRLPDAAAIAVCCRSIVVRDEFGRARQMIGALSDMTDTRLAQASAQALARASRLAAIGEITATITHEVNQPLAAILNNTETALYLMKQGRCTPELLGEILEDIRRDDLRASEVVRRTRALLQDRELVRQPVDLNDVVADAVRLLAETARRRNIDVIVTTAELALVHADALHLQQVLLNLLGNAFDAVDKAGGHKRVEVSTREQPGVAQISVTDSGCGIRESDLERIFESFHTSKAEGLGLGLSLARSIVRAHGGRIVAENNQNGRGATVRFELPVTLEHHAVCGAGT